MSRARPRTRDITDKVIRTLRNELEAIDRELARVEKKFGLGMDKKPTIEVRGVLAGAYKGKGRKALEQGSAATLHTHATADDGRTALCKRVGEWHLADLPEQGEPTCLVCAKRKAKLERA